MSQARAIKLETDVLGANNHIAAHNREHFDGHGVLALNLIDSPTGRALKAIHELRSIAHIIDMHQLTKDPERITGAPTDAAKRVVPDAVAAGTLDADRLAAAAAPFGVSYDVTTNAEGEIEVSHSGFHNALM